MPEHLYSFLRRRNEAMLDFLRIRAKGSAPRSAAHGNTERKAWPCLPVLFPAPLLAAGAIVFLCAALPGRPVETLHLQRRQGPGLQLPMPLGQAFTTRYIHSLERTPVEDIYFAAGGRIREWRTRTRSHNAGMPWGTPEQGRFLSEGPWLVLEGGRQSWEDLRLRVGDDHFGRNELLIGKGKRVELFRKFPGESLRFSASRSPLETFFH